jgi:hypothetical protein
VNGLEQPDVPAALVAVARSVVLLSPATVTVMPGDEKVAALPLANGDPEQSEVV